MPLKCQRLKKAREMAETRAHLYLSIANVIMHQGLKWGHTRTDQTQARGEKGEMKKGAGTCNGCSPIWWLLYSTKFTADLSPCRRRVCGGGSGLSLVLGVGLDCWREWSFFPAGWKADGHVCRAHDKRAFYVQRMQIEEASLCTDGDPMPGSACGAQHRVGGVALALSAITVSGGGRGHRQGKEADTHLVLPGSYKRRDITCNLWVGHLRPGLPDKWTVDIVSLWTTQPPRELHQLCIVILKAIFMNLKKSPYKHKFDSSIHFFARFFCYLLYYLYFP